MKRIELHAAAETDIIQIAEYGASQFGIKQAQFYHEEMIKQFELVAEYPQIGRTLKPLRSDLYRFGFGRHVIIYAVTPDTVEIRRILHDRMDILRHLGN